MVRAIGQDDVVQCVNVIQESFGTVAYGYYEDGKLIGYYAMCMVQGVDEPELTGMYIHR